jgi:hypothetical protein
MEVLMRLVPIVLTLALTPWGLAAPACAGPDLPPIDEELPGYYQFFHKTGRMGQIGPEVKRDARIRSGELKIETVDEALPGAALPDAHGKSVRLRDLSGKAKRSLLVVSFRSWW